MNVNKLQNDMEVEYKAYIGKKSKNWKKGKLEITKWGKEVVTIGIKDHPWAYFSPDWQIRPGMFYYSSDDGKTSWTLEIKLEEDNKK